MEMDWCEVLSEALLQPQKKHFFDFGVVAESFLSLATCGLDIDPHLPHVPIIMISTSLIGGT